MDLITYLKNTDNEELYEKIKTIVKLYKEREKNHKELLILNGLYNSYLTEKYDRESRKSKASKSSKESLLDKLKNIDPIMLLFMFIILPTPLLLMALVCFDIFIIVKLAKKTFINVKNPDDDFIDSLENFDQNKRYQQLCEVRELYHAKCKELDNALQNISNEDKELIRDFYGALEEYDNLLSLIANDLEEKVEVPKAEIHKTLEHRNI